MATLFSPYAKNIGIHNKEEGRRFTCLLDFTCFFPFGMLIA